MSITVEAFLGEIRAMGAFAAGQPPSGWRLCDGSLVKISDYTQLYSLIGTTFGGDGVSTFALPNLCGRLAVGLGKAPTLADRGQLGKTFGVEEVIFGAVDFPSHTHAINVLTSPATSTSPAGGAMTFAASTNNYLGYLGPSQEAARVLHLHSDAIAQTGTQGGHSNLMPTVGIYYIICMQGLTPLVGNQVPIVNGVSPNSGPPVPPSETEDGASPAASLPPPTVTINGLYFLANGTPAVSFGGVAAKIISTNGNTISVTCPPGNGRVPVTVSTSNGTSGGNAGATYTYIPSITDIVPPNGSRHEYTKIVIHGFGFTNVTSIDFGGVTLGPADFLVMNDGEIRTFAPPVVTETPVVSVSVTGTYGGNQLTSSPCPAATFDYSPVTTAVSPVFGPATGGAAITLTGSNYLNQGPNLAVYFGTQKATSMTVTSANTITAVAPAGTGVVPVYAAVDPKLKPITKASFSYAPIITSFTPTIGSAGTTVTVTGQNISPTSTVTFGSTAVNASQSPTATQIIAVAPAGTGDVAVYVNGPGGRSRPSTKQSLFSYRPQLDLILPRSGPPAGGNKLILTGQNFIAGAVALFGGTPVTPTSITPNAIEVTAPAGQTGATIYVSVQTSGGVSGMLPYLYGGPVGVTLLTPNLGSPAGGDTVIVLGWGFAAGATVSFGANLATNVVVNGPTSLTCRSPAGSGSAPVTVTANGSTSSTSEAPTFSYAPRIVSITPNLGPIAGGQTVTIIGANFVPNATSVTFDGVPATNVNATNSVLLTAVTPVGDRIAAVVATTSGGPSPSAPYSYTPSVQSIAPTHGPLAGGTTVILTGVGLTSATQVRIGSVNATSFGIAPDNSSLWAVTPPRPANTVLTATLITVVTPQGTTQGNPGSVFYYDPVIQSIQPTFGKEGTLVTITGKGFTGAGNVRFGLVAAKGITAPSDTQMTAVSPTPLPDHTLVEVVVIGPRGSSTPATVPVNYAYNPTVDGLSPKSGQTGTSVLIYGSGLDTVTSVTFGGVLLDFHTWWVDKAGEGGYIRALAPKQPSAKSLVSVVLGSTAGPSPTTANCWFQYTD